MDILTNEEKRWAEEEWKKLDEKLSVVSKRSIDKIPFWSHDGKHDDMTKTNIHCWTNGFWAGLMWLMYTGTQNEDYKKVAENSEKLLDRALAEPERLSHDVGFMWRLASGTPSDVNGDEMSWKRMRRAVDVLMARYNPVGEYLRAWNWGETPGEKAGWTIIDTMMNLPLLYWASRETQDPRFKFAAMKHSDKTMQYHIRPDGSVRHIVIYDPNTGEYLDDRGGQGYEKGSTWSRGQAWALYGFILGYIHTGKQEYLETAKRVAHYFISAVCTDWLPRCDFRSPKEPVYYDTSAGTCAACGLIEIARVVPEYEKRLYLDAAINILKAIGKNFADWSKDTDFIIGMATGSYENDHNMNIIYADYYYAEAIYKLRGGDRLFW